MWPHYIPEDHGQCKIKLTLYDDAFFKFTAFLCEWYLQKWFLKIFFFNFCVCKISTTHDDSTLFTGVMIQQTLINTT